MEDARWGERPLTATSLHHYRKARDSAVGLGLLGPPTGRVLDLGCGAAGDLRWLLDAGWRGVGLDPVRSPRGLPCVRGDAQRLPFRDGSFSATLSVLVLPHVANPQLVVAEAFRVAKPEGRAVFVVFSHSFLNARIAVGGVTYDPDAPPTPYRLFSVRQLQGMLAGAGFGALAWTRSDFPPWFLGLFRDSKQDRPFQALDDLEPPLSRSGLAVIARKIAITGTKPRIEREGP